jgi:hypothetical protein
MPPAGGAGGGGAPAGAAPPFSVSHPFLLCKCSLCEPPCFFAHAICAIFDRPGGMATSPPAASLFAEFASGASAGAGAGAGTGAGGGGCGAVGVGSSCSIADGRALPAWSQTLGKTRPPSLALCAPTTATSPEAFRDEGVRLAGKDASWSMHSCENT